MAKPIVIIGSSNTDMVIQADRLPFPGETVLGVTFFMNSGGKGANQAVAAARLGGDIIFICKIGDDIFARKALEVFEEEGIQTKFIVIDRDHPSGVALITINADGENCIVVAPGANAKLASSDLKQAATAIDQAGLILMQLEIPLDTVDYIASSVNKKVKVVLNPAPACELPASLLKNISIITPNEVEASKLTGINIVDKRTAESAARILHNKGIETVIITLGSEGALLFEEGNLIHVPAYPVKAVDTTAAGDVFNAALVVGISEGMSMIEAVEFACMAAAISVTRLGAQASAPFRNEMIIQRRLA
jgi:ribokinase